MCINLKLRGVLLLLRDGFVKPVFEVRWKISWLLFNVKYFSVHRRQGVQEE